MLRSKTPPYTSQRTAYFTFWFWWKISAWLFWICQNRILKNCFRIKLYLNHFVDLTTAHCEFKINEGHLSMTWTLFSQAEICMTKSFSRRDSVSLRRYNKHISRLLCYHLVVFCNGKYNCISFFFFPIQVVIWYLYQIASAVANIHKAGILHR